MRGIRRGEPLEASGYDRIDWIDYAKGIGIALVVLGHVERGLVSAAILSAGRSGAVDRFIYAFHMPLFFFLSGLFAGRVQPAGEVLAGKARTLLYPYMLWSLFQGAINIGLGSLTNNALAPQRLLFSVLLQPYGQFWFFYVLFLCHVLYQVLARARLVGWPTFLLAAMAGVLAPSLAWSTVLGNLAGNFVYFVLGTFIGRTRPRVELLRRANNLLIVVLASLVLAVCVHFDLDSTAPVRLGAAVVGVAGALALAMVLANSGALPLIRALGERSLPIYVAHIAAASGTRILLAKGFGIVDPAFHLTLGLVVGLTFPLGLAEAADILGIPWLFRLPHRVMSERYRRARAPQGPVAREAGVG